MVLVRFGFVAMSVELVDASPSKTVTLKVYRRLRLADPEAAQDLVRRTSRENLTNALRLLRHCKAHNVKLYRFSSKIIPLATHPELAEWDYIKDLKPKLAQIGGFIRLPPKIHVSSPRSESVQELIKKPGIRQISDAATDI
ncbi:MAG: hypothetical protein KGZ79_09735 [Dethiobacter sp.]|jgi:UV DNA damage endonuclease|nr:hypothetical protein [Dethiobacter sp.]MBS4022683.1 hypothetical protein [Dethiobacter sp.]